MKLILPQRIVRQLERELQLAGRREIGGILMGEHVSEGVFRICELTVQRNGGTWTSFTRTVHDSLRKYLTTFFYRHNHHYTRFNYLGEWHSHPSFSLSPSTCDQQSMLDIVNDPDVGANFAVLLIVKLGQEELQARAYLFVPNFDMQNGELIFEEE
ncbi:Mov34/MPN/PAD-1 family protein [Paenactinomyces guangxiensis]|uniref:Mov34/MPN/PAD-1 family protein n=1 Tax=Paenactinomyces guangxiensis TaxID=1490290 RepID=A0A7W1WUH5_9BACL|nr:Mov34/MPN/PAD-1 family protein [Paenactinomyces guangxiensis]